MTTTSDFAPARRAMIDSQLRPSGVNEGWVLAAMARVPREDFVPAAARAAAYCDRAVPLGEGHFLSPPLVHAMLLAEGAPDADDNVLVVSANGCLAALVRPLAGALTVIAPEAAQTAIAGGPFSLILIDGAAGALPPALTNALAEGGRLVTGLIAAPSSAQAPTRLSVGIRTGGALALRSVADIAIPPLAALAAPRRWSF